MERTTWCCWLRPEPEARTTVVLVSALLISTITACGSLTRRSYEEQLGEIPECFADWPEGGDDIELNLTGTWAQRQVTTSLASAPFVGDIHTTTTTLFRVEMVQTGASVSTLVRVCDIQTESTGSVQSTVSNSYIEAIDISERQTWVRQHGDDIRFFQEPSFRVLGATLENPAVDPLPDSPDDARIIDQDSDGHPGVTITVAGPIDGAIYIVQRVSNVLCGDVIDGETMVGTVSWEIEQFTIGASNFLLDRQNDSVPNPDPVLNTFEARRIDDSMSCADIVEQQEILFAQ